MSLMVSVVDIQRAYIMAWFCCSQYVHVLYIFYSLAAFLKDRKPWIVKPVASSRGRGIYLVNHVSTNSQAVKCLSSLLDDDQIC